MAENVVFDAPVLLRRISIENNLISEDNTNLVNAGIRLNIFKRDYDF
jgi:hypothetical protein